MGPPGPVTGATFTFLDTEGKEKNVGEDGKTDP